MQVGQTWATLVRDVWFFIYWTHAESSVEKLVGDRRGAGVPLLIRGEVNRCEVLRPTEYEEAARNPEVSGRFY